MEAELFGYERGAFTDAKESKLGLFEAADGGFLFLDEVGDVELVAPGQAAQGGRGADGAAGRRHPRPHDRRADPRRHQPRPRARRRSARRFRRDLYFRLAVILLHLPPLRERGDDVLLLAEHFLRRFSAKYGKDVRTDRRPGPRGPAARYPWPGNVRELSHVIERAVLWSRGPTLDVEHLSSDDPVRLESRPGPTVSRDAPAAAASRDRVDLGQWERTLIEQALREAGGNQTRAAQRLGITRDTLRYRLKKFGIQRWVRSPNRLGMPHSQLRFSR